MVHRKIYVCLLAFLLVLFGLSEIGVARKGDRKANQTYRFRKSTIQQQFTMEGNNWAYELTNYGPYGQDIAGRLPGGGAGGEFPKGTGTFVIFAAGLQIGALVGGIPKVSVIDFDSEFQPGAVVKADPYDRSSPGTPTNPGDAINKLFALTGGGADGTPVGSDGDAMDDFANWPAQYGAPTKADGSPLVIGDLMTWCVYNDYDPAIHVLPDESQPDPLYLEVQQLSTQVNITGYNDIFFMFWKVINKGTEDLNDVYIGAWFDADVDKASNDVIASDISRNMGIFYNSDQTDPVSGGNVAFGADFFQGPVVPGVPTDTASYLVLTSDGFVQRVVTGKKQLGMSSLIRYINVRGPEGDPVNDTELYNLMRGLEKDGTPKASPFAFPEDPVTGNPALLDPRPDDKRMLLNTGPFTLAVGDTQVVILACVGAMGADRLNAITSLRATDEIAQSAYDNKFFLPQPPPSPSLSVTPLDNKVVLTWDNSSELFQDRYPELTGTVIPGYRTLDFAGYKVYRSPSGTVGSWKLLAQFDQKDGIFEIPDTTFAGPGIVREIKVIPIGDDKGAAYAYIDDDVHNGSVYFYAVTAYDAQPSIASGAAPRTLESAQGVNAVKAVPQPPRAGYSYSASSQNTATHIGISDGSASTEVVDPTAVTGHEYEITFNADNTWNVTDLTTGEVKIRNWANQGELGPDAFPVVDGVLVRVSGPSLDFKNFETVANGAGPIVPPEGAAADFGGFPSLRPTDAQQVGDGHWFIHTADNGSRGSFDAFKARTTRDGVFWPDIVPYDFEIRFTLTGSMAFDFYNTGTAMFNVPFELWNIGIGTPNDASDDYRLVPWLLDDDGDGTFNMGQPGAKGAGTYDHSVSGGDNDPYTDWIYWQRPADTSPGEAGYLAAEAEMIAGTYTGSRETEIMARVVFVNWNGDVGATPPSGVYNQPLPETGTILRMTTSKPNLTADSYRYTTSTQYTFQAGRGKLDKNTVKIVPNPYYGFSSYDVNQFQRRVKITGLPSEATIRIFNVAGDLIRTINHNATSNNDREAPPGGVTVVAAPQFTSVEVWDLTTDNGLFISSGIYFLHIEAPGIGVTEKPIPFAIIQGNVQLTVPTN